jgi:RNA polymerase sigma-70 factor (ECF subfamily)
VTIAAVNRMWNPTFLKPEMVVEKAKNGDITALAELYTLYKTPVYNLCLRLTSDVLDAEDLMQEVFLQVYRKLNSFRGEAAFGSWLYRVATNVTMMHLRKRQVEEIPLDELELQNLECASRSGIRDRWDPIKRIALLRALCGLSKNRRTLILLHDLKGLSHNEIAQSLGVIASTSKARLHQAHRKLRETLGVTDMLTHRPVTHRSIPQRSTRSTPTGMDPPVCRYRDQDDCVKDLGI